MWAATHMRPNRRYTATRGHGTDFSEKEKTCSQKKKKNETVLVLLCDIGLSDCLRCPALCHIIVDAYAHKVSLCIVHELQVSLFFIYNKNT